MIRLAVACDPNHCDAESQAVLEWSVRKNTSRPVEITWVKLSNDPSAYGYGWQTENWATSFSALRWGLAEMYGHEGQYIYADSDVIFLADLGELWDQPFAPGKVAMAKGGGSWRYCVSKWNAAEAAKHIPSLEKLRADPTSHAKMTAYFRERPNLTQAFSGNWNCLDGENYKSLSDPAIKAIHYTSIGTQPQLRHAMPRLAASGRKHWFNGEVREHWRKDLIELFDELLAEATAEGYGPARYLQDPPYGDVRKRDMQNYRSGRKS